jgi:hypothetical protein
MRGSTHHHSLPGRTCLRSRRFIIGVSILSAMLLPLSCPAQSDVAPEKKDKGVMIRVLCVQSLTRDEEETVLASQTEDGKWIEHGKLTLRTPFISSWFRVRGGMTHLTRKEGNAIKSIGSFSVPKQTERSIIILVPDTGKKIYRAQVVDPGNLGFQKGKALVLNYSNVPAMVKIGKNQVTIPPGQKAVTTIDANEDGMYRLLVGHLDKDGKIVPCYDKQVSSNPQTRKFILLFPGRNGGLRSMSLSEFGPFE